MADNSSGQERTEEATPKKRTDAREKGDIVRSRELTTMLLLLSAVAGLYLSSAGVFAELQSVFERGFTPTRAQIFDTNYPYTATRSAMLTGLAALGPLLVLLTFVSVLGPTAVGGWSFNPGSAGFKWNRLDPIAGLKRVFGARGLVEMVKALAKFVLILGFALTALYHEFANLKRLGVMAIESGLLESAEIIFHIFFISCLATLLIAMVDVPYQLWEHGRKLRMSRQEVKDETKQQEGSPETRSRIRTIQQEMANRRMMEEVPSADVIVTNPSHYAVALRFDAATMAAPVLLAKGADHLAFRIRDIGSQSGVEIVAAPALARAIYHSTKLNAEIPAGLYLAVAQVLAYVYQLKRGAKHAAIEFTDLPIPPELQQ